MQSELKVKLVKVQKSELKRRMRATLRSVSRPGLKFQLPYHTVKVELAPHDRLNCTISITEQEINIEELLMRGGVNVEHLIDALIEGLENLEK